MHTWTRSTRTTKLPVELWQTRVTLAEREATAREVALQH